MTRTFPEMQGRPICGAPCVALTAMLLAGCSSSAAPLTVPSGPAGSALRSGFDYCTGQEQPAMVAPAISVRDDKPNVFPRGLTPGNIQAAYGLPSLASGNGQVVAIVLQCDNPNVAGDQAVFRTQFGLPAGKFHKYNEDGKQRNYPPTNPPWGVFNDVGVETIAAVCPNCTIDLVEANNLDAPDLEKATMTAVALGAHIVAEPWGCTYSGCLDPSYFDKRGITYVGLGVVPQPDEVFPADLDTVVAAGGTYLTQGGGGKRGWTETEWRKAGGGCFTDVPKPTWQRAFSCSGRVSNDVSMVANGIDAYDSFDGLGSSDGWINVSGTGIPVSFIAAVFALAGNAQQQNGGRTFWRKDHQQHLYRIDCEASCVYGTRFSYADGWGSPHGTGAF